MAAPIPLHHTTVVKRNGCAAARCDGKKHTQSHTITIIRFCRYKQSGRHFSVKPSRTRTPCDASTHPTRTIVARLLLTLSASSVYLPSTSFCTDCSLRRERKDMRCTFLRKRLPLSSKRLHARVNEALCALCLERLRRTDGYTRQAHRAATHLSSRALLARTSTPSLDGVECVYPLE